MYWVFFCPNMWSTIEKVPQALEKNMYAAAFCCNIVYKSIQPTWLNVLLMSVFPCWLSVWMIYPLVELGVKFLLIFVLLSISPFRSINNCFIYFGALTFVCRAEMSLLEAAYWWVLLLIHPATLCLLIGKFSQLKFRVLVNKSC